MTTDEAIAFAKTEWWKGLPADAIVAFQLYEDLLCMDFGDFHEAVETALGRSVWAHEFAFRDKMQAEFEGKGPKPTMADILDLIPAEKRIVVMIPDKERPE